MNLEIRVAPRDDAERVWRLGHEAFGYALRPPRPGSFEQPGATSVIAMDGDTMAGRMVHRVYDCWFGGKLVPTSGVADVAIATEYRSQGVLSQLVTRLFQLARSKGAVVSALYPTSVEIYRRLGYEVICTSDRVRFSAAALSRVLAPAAIETRRATPSDAAAIRAVYDVWGAAHNGPLSRRGASFRSTDEELIKSLPGITVAERAGAIIGYLSWNRASSSGPDGEVSVFDLIATERDGYLALLAALRSCVSILSWVRIENGSGIDLVLELSRSEWQVLGSQPYMLKVIDVAGALEARGYPAVITTGCEFGVTGDTITGTNGYYRLDIADGSAACTRLGDLDPDSSVPVFTPNGLALAYAGSQSAAGIRTIGGLMGPTDCDEIFNAVFGGRPVRIRDHY